MLDGDVVVLCKNLGKAAILALNSSGLKDSNPLLYFALKDAAVVLANSKPVKVVPA